MSVQRYVGGYAFDEKGEWVLLVRKGHGPPLNVGKLNGIGGHCEWGEPPRDAQVREFEEETGIETAPDDWQLIAVQWSDDLYRIWWYAVNLTLETLLGANASTGDLHGEDVDAYAVRDLWERADLAELTRVHLALALDTTATFDPPDLEVRYEDESVAASPLTQADRS